MNCKCNCSRNGSDKLDFLLPAEATGVYEIGLTHFTCGNRKMAVADTTHPVTASLTATAVGTPIDLGNGAFCQECQIAGTVTYKGCGCCEPRTEYVSCRVCLPCTSATQPTLTIGTVAASPKPISYYQTGSCGCCQGTYACTNQIAITTSVAVTAG